MFAYLVLFSRTLPPVTILFLFHFQIVVSFCACVYVCMCVVFCRFHGTVVCSVETVTVSTVQVISQKRSTNKKPHATQIPPKVVIRRDWGIFFRVFFLVSRIFSCNDPLSCFVSNRHAIFVYFVFFCRGHCM
jgi:hypothetical protein